VFRALIVDPDVDSRRMYADYLAFNQWQVEQSADGRQAFALALSARPDVVITETRLDGMSGFDLCELLRRDYATRDLPILVVTADAVTSDVERAKACGADAVLVKPCAQRPCWRQRTAWCVAHESYTTAPVERVNLPLSKSNRRGMFSGYRGGSRKGPPSAQPTFVAIRCRRRCRLRLCSAQLRRTLVYEKSFVGGVIVRHPEQWDYFRCNAGCGEFQYRHRTRRLRRIS
jgi:CheY-like chemotaxis protein